MSRSNNADRHSGETVTGHSSALTAMQRVEMSRPVRLALEEGVIEPGASVFDYGCGYGHDIDFLRELGHDANGWDPHHRPDGTLTPAAVVNLGYVVNVLEEPSERFEVLQRAYELAERALVIAVRGPSDRPSIADATPHSDGFRTGRGSFQRLFSQSEARDMIEAALDADSVPLAPGVFVVFCDPKVELNWLDHRQQLRRRVRRLRRMAEPRKTKRDRAYDDHRELLAPLEEFLVTHGRLPKDEEVDWATPIQDALGSLPKAFQVLRHVADNEWWALAADERRTELRIRLALARLRRRRPKYSGLPTAMKHDIRALFGSYKRACDEADTLLFSIGSDEVLRHEASNAVTGKRTSDSLYIHVDAADVLPPALQVFLGAAEAVVGSVPDATILKLHLDKPRVSYLVYPNFDTDPHPALAESWVVDLRELDVRPSDYRSRDNPPILHRKELFVTEDYHRYSTFRRLTEQEERFGLYEDGTTTIGTRHGWQQRLDERGVALRGHRVVRTASPN